MVVRSALNKLDRLCLKEGVIYLNDGSAVKKDKVAQIKSFYEQLKPQIAVHEITIGEKVQAEISLVKDYGLIVSVEKY